MPTSVVTGGAGFLGSHLCDHLLEQGHRVICVDNLETGSLENIAHLRDDAFSFVYHDVVEPIQIDEPVDYVFHLAALASPVDYLRAPLASLKVGSYGTHNALGLAKWKRARFLISSTSEVYGDPQVHPQPETYWGNVNPIGPRGVYDEAKRYAEALTMTYHAQQGVDTCIARIFNTYGPRMRKNDGRASVNFLNQAIGGKPLTVYGDGSQTRSLCYVDDLIRGLYLLMMSDEHLPVNIGNPDHEVTMLELAQTVIRVTRLDERDRLRGAADRRPADPPPRHHARAPDPRLGARDRPRGRPAALAASRSAGSRSRPDVRASGARRRRRSRRRSSLRPRSPRRASRYLRDRHLRRGADALRADRQDDADAQAAARAGGAAEPLLGRRAYGVAQQRPANATNPADPAYDWALYDRTVRYANAVRHPRALLDLRHAGLGERRPRRRTHAPTRSDRPAQLRARGRQALRRRSSRTARAGSCRRSRSGSRGTSRTTRSSSRRSTRGKSDPERDRLREDLQRRLQRRARDAVRRRARRLRRHGAARQQQPVELAAVRLAARLPARRQEGGPEDVRRVGAPPVLRGPERHADDEAGDAEGRARRPRSRSATSAT